jgi:hypothetical protein
MRKQYFNWLMAGLLLIGSIAGCGGGSGGSGTSNTVIRGTASKGIIYPGMVNVYAIDANGVKGALLAGPVQTKSDGTYSASLGTYNGAVHVEASGTYTDEATGQPVTIDPAKPLHALLDTVGNGASNRVVSVTPLTEIAWRMASASGTAATPAAAIVSANRLVSDLFKISDIVGIEPVSPDSTSMDKAAQEPQAYTMVLATLSQMAKPASGAPTFTEMDNLLDAVTNEVQTTGGMSAGTMSGFAAALSRLSMTSSYMPAATQISGAGRKSQLLTLAISGALPSGSNIYAVQAAINPPLDPVTGKARVSFRASANGAVPSNLFSLIGGATALGGLVPQLNYQSSTQQLSFAAVFTPGGTGIGTGDFATLTYDVLSSTVVTVADFSIAGGSVKVKDANGAAIDGVTVALK